jgi:hypothetical protein
MPDGAVLFSTETEQYFGLNQTGACIWRNLHPVCATVQEICIAVDREFPGGEAQRVRNDVERILALFVEKRLVDPRPDV